MKPVTSTLFLLAVFAFGWMGQGLPTSLSSALGAEPFLVENGVPRAEIVVGVSPTRSQRVAAHELREQLEKISGARLGIVTVPSGRVPVKVYVGVSEGSPVSAEGLADGAFRLESGPDWLALVGNDADFAPQGPFARNNGDIPRAQAEWEGIVGAPYGLPSPGLYKHRMRLPADMGLPEGAVAPKKGEFLELWGLDERGSFNAVTAFLHRLGARWYLPGELGAVLPSQRSIALPAGLDETVRPDFRLRQFNFRFATVGPETALWSMRLGMRHDERLQIAHGLATMTNREAVFAKHPEWFALYGGKRDFRPGDSKCQLCYSNEGLFQETVRWARAQVDAFGYETVSIMPPDGYTSICQCESCRGKDSPERHERGLLSDYVWEFVNRVAKELGKTHPQAKVLNCAYGVYTLPPEKIEKLEPNVLVCIVGGRRPINKAGAKGEGEAAPEALRAAWAKKTDNPLLIFENYPFTDRGWYLPSYTAKSLVDTVKATKEVSQGEDIWLSVRQDFDEVGIGFNHFLVYFTVAAYWGGQAVDGEALLREYCRLFYGPAEAEMLAFFHHCEEHWKVMDEDKGKADEALALFEKAKGKAGAEPESLYGRRLALVDDYLKGLRMKSQQLGQKRGPVPSLRLVGDAEKVVVDGSLEDDYWQRCPTAATGKLRELETGRVPVFATTVQAGWQAGSVVFAIHCEEGKGEKPVSTSTRDDDPAIWHGDVVEIEIATETHSYYQIAVSPSGHVADLDRGAPAGQWFGWDAKAEVATRIAEDGSWTVELRLPVTQDENDPLHQVVGRKPTPSLPWHVNICRQRVREDGTELSALSPTGTSGFHEPMKFARFFDGRSTEYDADPTVTDFLLAFRAAQQARQAGPFAELADGKGLPEGTKLTDAQKSAALELAAFYEKDREKAAALAERIALEPVRKTAKMQLLLSQGKAPELVAEYGGEDFAAWPFWKRGDGLHARGRAYFVTKAGDRAETDLTKAVQWLSEPRARDAALLVLGQNRERNLGRDEEALAAYREIVAGRTRIGGADEYAALQGLARVLAKQGKYDDALAELRRAEPEKLQGVWRENILRSVAEVEKARAGK